MAAPNQPPTSGSETARFMRSLPKSMLGHLSIEDEHLVLLEALDSFVRVMIMIADGADEDEIERCFDDLNIYLEDHEFEALQAYLESEELTMPQWVVNLKRPAMKALLLRILGPAKFEKFRRAALNDRRFYATVIQRGVRMVLPAVAALEGCVELVGPTAIDGLAPFLETSLLTRAIQGDRKLSEYVGIDPESANSGGHEEATEAFLAQLMAVRPKQVNEMLGELNSQLSRKLEGARHAMDNSPDGISQGANSLVELIDRLLRTTFSQQEVTEWLAASELEKPAQYMFDRGGQQVPTKFAQALCFVYAGKPATDYSVIHQLAAKTLVEARNRLERLKHADDGSRNELDELQLVCQVLEGFLLLTVNFGWKYLAAEGIDSLRVRLEIAA